MTAVLKPELIPPGKFLSAERRSEVRHEYFGGHVAEVATNTDDHNRIVGNISSELCMALRGKRCEPFALGMLLKIGCLNAFYYPDVFVVCDPKDNAKYFRERPTVVFEVLSPETERIDTREKQTAYAAIPSLKIYVLVSQNRMEATVWRKNRRGVWASEILSGGHVVLKLPEITAEIPLSRIYERTTLASRQSK